MTSRGAAVCLGVLIGGAGVVLAQDGTDAARLDLTNPVVVVWIAILAVRAALELLIKAIGLIKNGRQPTPLRLDDRPLAQLRSEMTGGIDRVIKRIDTLEETHRHERDQLWAKVNGVRSDVDVMKGKLEATHG